MKISVSVALNTKGPSAKVKEKMKVARAALKHLIDSQPTVFVTTTRGELRGPIRQPANAPPGRLDVDHEAC